MLANFVEYKGHQFFLEAWSAIAKNLPKGVALLLWDGPLRQELETKVGSMGLRGSVRFLGIRQDVPVLLALMDLVVHPSSKRGSRTRSSKPWQRVRL